MSSNASSPRRHRSHALRALLILLLAAAPGALHAQSAEDCLRMFRTAYKRITSPGAGKICRLDLDVRTTSRIDGRASTTSRQMTLVAGERRMEIVSGDFELYQDGVSSFLVIPSRRTVTVTDADMAALRERRTMLTSTLQDSMLKVATALECAPVREAGSSADRRLKLGLPGGFLARTRIASVTAYLDTRRQALCRMVIEYAPGSPVLRVDVVYRKVDPDYQAPSFDQPLASRFMTPGGALTAKYGGYRLIDARKRTSDQQ